MNTKNNETERCLKRLYKNRTILYPTDTVWGIGCDATNESAVSKIYKIKNRAETKSLVILVNSIEMLEKHIENIPQSVIDFLKNIKNPTSIIYKNPKGLAKNVIAEDNSVAIRIVKNEFCNQLIEKFEKPIVSTSANVSGEETPKSFNEISKVILESVDYIVNLHRDVINSKSSTILKIDENNQITTIRS